MGELQVWADGVAGTVIGADVWNGRTVLATDWSGGRLLALTVERGELTEWGDGYVQPEGVSVVGDEALITERGGTLLHQDLLNPGRANATVVATGLGAPHQVVRSDDGGAALIADHAGGRIVSVDLATGATQDVVVGLSQPVGVAVGPAGELYVTEQGTGTLSRHDADGTASVVVGGLVSPFFVAWADPLRTSLLVTERAPAHRVGVVDLTAAVPAVERLVGRGITQPSHAIVVQDRLVVTGANRVLSLDASAGLHGGVTIGVPSGPLWPGSWADVEIDTGVTGWTRADLDLVTDPPGVLTLSEHPGADADPTHPTVRLLAHATLERTDVVARDAATLTELGRATVEVGFDPTSPVDGPPLWIDGPTQPPVLHTLALTAGVDDAGAKTPKDAAGTKLTAWRVAAILVDTLDARWPAAVSPANPAPTIADAKTTWRNVLVGTNGVDAFYREMSGNRLGMQLAGGAVQGPVGLDGTWTDWFSMITVGGISQWIVKDDVVQRAVSGVQGQGGIDWTAVDAVFLVFRSAGGNFIWPRAQNKVYKVQVKAPDGSDRTVEIAKVGMPHDQLTAPNLGFTNVEVSSHELGHTLGLADLYMDTTFTTSMRSRDLTNHELMSDQTGLPHLSARHKLLLGFLDTGHVRSFAYGFQEDVTIELAPLAAGLPTGGRFAAVELKVAPRLSWFFEYRAGQPGKLGDGAATAFPGGKVMGYNATSYEFPPVVADKRQPIILLLDDGDGEGSILAAGNDYDHLDVEGDALSQFRVDVVSMTATSAKIRVRVGKVAAPDPWIQGNNGEAGDYKSPDIEIRNEVSDKDGTWLNKPIIGLNRLVAKVHNGGGLDAPDVSVRFKILPFNTDDPDSERWDDLGDPVKHDIAAGQTVEFQTEWSPDHDAHFCIQARIDRYTSIPRAKADEPDVDNNLAQSNYFDIYSKPSSPASREVSDVEVHNPYPYALDALVDVSQDSTAYRSYVDHQWLHLEPGQTRTVRLEVESKATTIWDAVEREYPDGRTWLRSWLPGQGCVARTGSGVTLVARTAVATELRVVERSPGGLLVQVVSPAGAPAPSTGSVAMQVDYEDERHDVVVGDIENDGFVHLRFDPVRGRGVLHFSGTRGYAPTSGIEVDLPD